MAISSLPLIPGGELVWSDRHEEQARTDVDGAKLDGRDVQALKRLIFHGCTSLRVMSSFMWTGTLRRYWVFDGSREAIEPKHGLWRLCLISRILHQMGIRFKIPALP